MAELKFLPRYIYVGHLYVYMIAMVQRGLVCNAWSTAWTLNPKLITWTRRATGRRKGEGGSETRRPIARLGSCCINISPTSVDLAAEPTEGATGGLCVRGDAVAKGTTFRKEKQPYMDPLTLGVWVSVKRRAELGLVNLQDRVWMR